LNVKQETENPKVQCRRAFTLLELMVAMIILTIAMSIAFQAFTGTIRGWKRGTEVVEGIKHGDFAMTQLSAAINSTIYFFNPRKNYAFEIEKDTTRGLPSDTLSFVTASSAFIPAGSPFEKGPHRLKIFIDDDDYGDPALFASAMPAVANDEDVEDEYDEEPTIVTRSVQGLEILIWDEELEDWTDEWEKENAVPERVLIRIYVVSEDENEEPMEFVRVLDIPVAPSQEAKLTGPSSGANQSGTSGTAGGTPGGGSSGGSGGGRTGGGGAGGGGGALPPGGGR
jgi:prepilin-type N-terminal cleavage/methylation domain-containing protein